MSTPQLDTRGADLAELGAADLLTAAEEALTRRRAAEVDDMLPTPYDADGPPGQTGLHNSGPLGRRHHRWKTHAGHHCRQSGTTRWVWRTPHGRYYVVDHAGTRRLDSVEGRLLMSAAAGVELHFVDLPSLP